MNYIQKNKTTLFRSIRQIDTYRTQAKGGSLHLQPLARKEK
jgi:hypothetical protein